jgi:hypothetical protein
MNKFINLSSSERNKLAHNGRIFVEKNFDEKHVINKYLKIIHNDK